MAGILDSTKIDKLFKSLFNKARTSANKAYYEETIPTVPDLHADEIYLNPIPATPPTSDTSIVKLYTSSAALTLTKDQSVGNNKAWVVLPAWQTGWSSGSDDVSQVMKNFISPKYGVGYGVKVYFGNGTRIPELDNLNWMFDYKAGVLTFENDPGVDGATVGNSIKIEVYQYVGQTVANAATSSSLESATDIDMTGKTKGSILMYDDVSGKWKPVSLTSKPNHFETQVIEEITDTVTLSREYTVGDNSLMVFINGALQLVGEANDYVETDNLTITFNSPLQAGDIVILRVASAGYFNPFQSNPV